jgi:MYXO-CTERM domain-containing protein
MVRRIAFAALIALAVPAFGQSITLDNPGFELPATGKIATGFDTPGSDIPGWSNAGTIYTDSGVEDGGRDSARRAFLRSSDDGIFQTTAHTIAASERLSLSFWASSTWQSTEVTGGLFYLDTGGLRQNLAALGAVVGTGTGSGPFAEYTLSFDIPDGSAAIGQPVGVFFDNTSTNTGDAWAGLDDVALTVTLVPEPGALALLGLLSLPLLRRRRN